jgi:transcriptional regulator with XRE-family HTH domain
MEMGEKIKMLRERNSMTLEELGNKVGVGKSTVRKWENGMIANMRRDKIAKLANALNCSPGYLMGWEQEKINAIAEIQKDANTYDDVQEESLKSLYEEFGEMHFTSSDIQKVQKFMRAVQRRNSCDVILELELTDEEIDEVYQYAKYLISKRKDN